MIRARALVVGAIVGMATTTIVIVVDAPTAVWIAMLLALGLLWLALCAIALGPQPGLGGERR